MIKITYKDGNNKLLYEISLDRKDKSLFSNIACKIYYLLISRGISPVKVSVSMGEDNFRTVISHEDMTGIQTLLDRIKAA